MCFAAQEPFRSVREISKPAIHRREIAYRSDQWLLKRSVDSKLPDGEVYGLAIHDGHDVSITLAALALESRILLDERRTGRSQGYDLCRDLILIGPLHESPGHGLAVVFRIFLARGAADKGSYDLVDGTLISRFSDKISGSHVTWSNPRQAAIPWPC